MKTQNSLFLTLLITVILGHSWGQTFPTKTDDVPYIEINGYAEKEVIPNEIYIGIVLHERMENKEKITIEFQEKQLIEAITKLNIPLTQLSVSDANADYVRVKWQKRDVMTKKEYQLKVENATAVGHVFEALENLSIQDGYISHVSHTEIDSLRQAVRIEAIKAAKNKADYLLEAIGQQTGKALIISEQNTGSFSGEGHDFENNITANYNSSYGNKLFDSYEKKNEIEFKKIKLHYGIYAKFSIK